MSLMCAGCTTIMEYGTPLHAASFIESDAYAVCEVCLGKLPPSARVPVDDDTPMIVIWSGQSTENWGNYSWTDFRRVHQLFGVPAEIVRETLPLLAQVLTVIS